MDPLDRLAAPAADLLGRVDDLLAQHGVPDGHRIWPLLSRLRALPGEAVAAFAALRPEPMAATSVTLRGLISEYAEVSGTLSGELPWEGAGAQLFAARRSALAAHLTDGPESLTARLEASASYLEAVAGWVRDNRALLARTLADVLGSAEAVTVVAGVGADATSGLLAAAEIGAWVLAILADAAADADALGYQWSSSLTEVAYRPPADSRISLEATTRLAF